MSGPYTYGSTQPLEVICPHCGRPNVNTPGMTFCNWCGQSLAGASARVQGMYAPQQPQQAQPQYPPAQPPTMAYYPPQQPPQQPPQITYVMPPMVMQPPYQAYPPSPVVVVNQSRKSVFLAFLLTFFFGPLGMFYSTVVGAITMLLVSVCATTLFFTLVVNQLHVYDTSYTDSEITWVTPLAFAIWGASWLISIIWAMAAAASYNNKSQTTIVR